METLSNLVKDNSATGNLSDLGIQHTRYNGALCVLPEYLFVCLFSLTSSQSHFLLEMKTNTRVQDIGITVRMA